MQSMIRLYKPEDFEVGKYFAGKGTPFQWFVGQVARATKGKADPTIIKDLMFKGLEARRK